MSHLTERPCSPWTTAAGATSAACLAGDGLVVVSAPYRHQDALLADNPQYTQRAGESISYGRDDGYVLPAIFTVDIDAGGSWTTWSPNDQFFAADFPNLDCAGSEILVSEPIRTSPIFALDSASGQWRILPDPPVSPVPAPHVWTGTELVFTRLFELTPPGLAYNPATNTWRTIFNMPELPGAPLWSGRAIVGYDESSGDVFSFVLPKT